MASIDQYSLATVPIEMAFQETNLSLGTAFTWKSGSEYFLITNWHNLSGKNPRTGQHLSPTAAEPDRIRVWWNIKGQLGAKVAGMVAIRDDDHNPLWWVHPQHQQKVDVVALPIDPPDNVEMYPINEMWTERLLVTVGQDVFILGYPFGIGHSGLPVWKRGSLASEPEVIDAADPCIFVDSASRPGMSGSPVIRRSWGMHHLEGNNINSGGAATRFVGVYSGRLSTVDPNDAQLGLAWPAFLLEQIIAGRTVDGS